MIVRPSSILWLVLWVVAAFGLYMVKYKVQALKVEVARTENQLQNEKKSLHVLNAEWTYLNRPSRLQQLSTKYLDVKPARGVQLVDFSSLPVNSAVVAQQASATEHTNKPIKGVTLASGVAHDQ